MDHVVVEGVRLEYRRIEQTRNGRPVLVFLHEGLGCAASWKDFPDRVAAATGCGAIVYSRAGYGGSDPVALPRPLSYMHEEGLDVLPALLGALEVDDSVLIGHSDGASIAIVHGGSETRSQVRGLVLESPHVFVEEFGLVKIRSIEEDYRSGDLQRRLARYHEDVDGAFWGWHGAWTDPRFVDWNIESYLPQIQGPVLIIWGQQDPYGSVAQLDAIDRSAGGAVERLVVSDAGHSPHRDSPDLVIDSITRFVAALGPGASS